MKKTLSVLALASVFAASSAFASGYRIPEQSVDSTAKSGANVASSTSADISYFNPANMAWAGDGWMTEVDLSWIYLSAIEYEDNRSPTLNGESETENFFLPTVFLVSPDFSNFRFGFAVTAPFGLAKRWRDPFPGTYSQKFSLQVFELNPSVSYKFNEYVSVAAGLRMLMSQAVAKNGGTTTTGVSFSRELKGEFDVDWGYNLALSFKPMEDLNLSVTYRSEVDMDLSGDATLWTNFPTSFTFESDGNVTLPAPAVLALSAAYTWNDLTVELTWDRTFWSAYEELDIQYSTPLTNPVLFSIFGSPVPKDWDDTDAFRLGLTYKATDAITVMAGFAFDSNPVPEEHLSFELPDSDAYIFSIGGRYAINEQMEAGVGFLYDYKKSREVSNSTINGEFTNAAAMFLTVGLSYKF
ncbi:MAG: aromatic hydrocarbon degradation protein [Desulfobulbaceae bacterium]|nr:MAG: aromatic hydrocarbon degradation protein [Desulfobulbaceae bacterium]